MNYTPIELTSLTPLHDGVIVSEMNFSERVTSGGIVIKGDDARTEGIRPRWAKVYAIGPDQKEFTVGQWVCIAHGRWTRGVNIKDSSGKELVVRRVDLDDILLVSDEQPSDDTISQGI